MLSFSINLSGSLKIARPILDTLYLNSVLFNINGFIWYFFLQSLHLVTVVLPILILIGHQCGSGDESDTENGIAKCPKQTIGINTLVEDPDADTCTIG